MNFMKLWTGKSPCCKKLINSIFDSVLRNTSGSDKKKLNDKTKSTRADTSSAKYTIIDILSVLFSVSVPPLYERVFRGDLSFFSLDLCF